MSVVVTLPAPGRRTSPWYDALWAWPVKRFWECFAGVLGLMAWNAFWRLGDTFVRDYDEGRYGVAASEMLHRHSLLVTTYAGATEYWNLKPPLGYWLLELSYALFGESSLTLRLPAAVCAVVTTALTMLLARRVGGPRLGILAGIILATSFGFLAHHGARSGELDVPLTLFLFLMLMLATRMFDSRAARLGLGLALSLAFLLKSFAILPFVAAIALYGLIVRGFASWRIWVLPVCIALVTTITWAVARTVAEDSGEFVRRMFLEDLLLRSTTAIDPVRVGPFDYVGALFDRLVPWPFLVIIALTLSWRFAGRRLSGDFSTLLWCYCLVPLVLFTLARTHHSHYIVPLYPAWSILGAAATLEVLRAAHRTPAAHWVAGVLVVCVLACQLRMVAHIEVHDRLRPSQIFLTSLGERVAPGTRLHTTFTPSYSERFFLQVVDGFALDDEPPNRNARPASMVLIRKSEDGTQRAQEPTDPAAIVAQGQDYVLMRTSQ
jgi:4-amino-4-deoxy-L-arabinose transferase-like glycosyltransferase